MFIKELEINNFRIFPFSEQTPFQLRELRLPTGENGSGLNIFVGENGTGKTSILDAISMCFAEYKGDAIRISDFNCPDKVLAVKVLADKTFAYSGVMPRSAYRGKGFLFFSKIRDKNTNHLSSTLVHDLIVIKADGELKPEKNSPDLRVSVKNPWKGNRFSNTELMYIEKNRNYSIKTGTFNDTKFDRIMEDLNRQVVQKNTPVSPLNEEFSRLKQNLDCQILGNAIKKFKECTGIPLELKLVDSMKPFTQSFLARTTPAQLSLPLSKMGSGFEMMFSLVYSLADLENKNKEIIILIDEPEMHLHPKLQEKFVQILFELTAKAQVFITTHSPLLLKQIFQYTDPNTHILKCSSGEPINIDKSLLTLPYVSANEINYLAFNLPTEEYFNELYGRLLDCFGTLSSKVVDEKLQALNIPLDRKWIDARNKETYSCSQICYIRNCIHHPENNLNVPYSSQELEENIEKIRSILTR